VCVDAVLEGMETVDNTVEENSSVFSLIQMHWLLSTRACSE